MIEARETAALLGGRRVLRREIKSSLDLHQTVLRGLPVAALRQLIGAVYQPAKRPRQAAPELGWIVPRGTYKRRLRTGVLSPAESERTARLARVFATARKVLGDDGMARAFLFAPHPELRGDTPIDVVRSEPGARQVEEILWGVYYGIPA